MGPRIPALSAVACLTTLLALPAASAAKPNWIEASDRNAMVLLESQGRFAPESASSNGLASFDGQVLDLGPDRYQRRQDNDRALLADMQGRLATEQQARVRQDIDILISALEQGLTTRSIHHEHLLPYFNLHESIFRGFNSLLDARTDAERYPAALQRLARYAGTPANYTPITELAMDRTRERFDTPGLLGPYRGQLQADLQNAPRYVTGIRSLFQRSGLTGWEPDLAQLETQLEAYRQWLEEQLLPRARDDNRLPAVVYADRLRGYGVDADPEELIEKAQYSYQLLRSEMKMLARKIAIERGWKDTDLVPVMRALKAEQIPQDRILAVYKSRLAEVEKIIRREGLVTLPKRDASIRLATEAEAAAIPASFMSPPQLINNTGQYGEFVLVQSNPNLEAEAQMDDWAHDAITWALTVHEARPGHELQFASLVENGTSLARALYAFNSANAEGWGLYAESIMQEYLPLEGQLFNLFTRLMRAARMFMDPMINTGQMTHEQAVTFMMEEMALSKPMASSEADRYTFRSPGQATSYYWGYMSLMRLRTELEIALGPDFDQLAFHDFVLEQGLLPPDLLRQAVLEEFVVPAKKKP